MSCTGCSLNSSANYLAINSYSWLDELPDTSDQSDIVEVKFKSTRKEYFKNSDKIDLKRGDKVVVATSPGHDVGEVTLTGYLAEKQFKLKIRNTESYKLNSVYRKSTTADVALLEDARNREKPVMIRARQIVLELGLDMKIGDVEFRGDGKKAIFYYLADGRVDFRELIKVYAREFGILIEMKQIGARQEAGIVGGIGSCGRELCCSSWRTNFKSISSNAALKQGLSPSALKMAGACGKLKCCLMYELDTYIEAQKDFPHELLNLELAKGIAKPFKTDYLKKEICYVMEGGGMFYLTLQQVKDIIQKNKHGIRPEVGNTGEKAKEENQMEVKLDERIDRFDKNKRTINKKRRSKFKPRPAESGK
jgi:cell fate regulator YaaT (PSP1 superfamily)